MISEIKFPEAKLSGEEFRLITDFEAYCISNYGRIYSRWHRGSYGKVSLGLAWKPLSPGVTRTNHLSVSLCSTGTKTTKWLHVIVLETFVGPRPIGHDGCHNDGDSRNNFVGNLRWDTPKGNMCDRFMHGNLVTPDNKGSNCGNVKLSEKEVIEIRWKRGIGVSREELAFKYGVSLATISDVDNRKSWKHI